ncbi:MAG: hypothetical protein IT449_10290 [Phycisphaerales bacterium]|nr:hypothetical protein [Phycisphaerales bacterium]
MSDHPSSQVAAAAPKRSALYILGLLLTLAAVPAYLLLINVPILRSTGLVAFILMGGGLLVGAAGAKRDARLRTRIVGGINALLVATGVYMFIWGAMLPASETAADMDRLTDFTLPDQNEKPVQLASLYAKGPTLLVFYRGHW